MGRMYGLKTLYWALILSSLFLQAKYFGVWSSIRTVLGIVVAFMLMATICCAGRRLNSRSCRDKVISDESTTTFPAHGSGYLHVRFSASIRDFQALARYVYQGYYDLPITVRLRLVELMNNAYKSYDYTIRTHVTVKTSNNVYGAVLWDIGNVYPLGKTATTIGKKFTLIAINAYMKKESVNIVIRIETKEKVLKELFVYLEPYIRAIYINHHWR